MQKHRKGKDGLYHIGGETFKQLVGKRVQVYRGTAYKTSGGVTKKGLVQTADGRIKSLSKHLSAKRENRLEKHGWCAEPGKFGAVRCTPKGSSKRKSRRSSRRKAHTVGGKTRRR